MEYGWLTIVPPLVAITLALITKQVIVSLLVGILSGAFILTGFSPIGAVSLSAATMWENITDPWNVAILIFLVTLGILTYLMIIAGGAAAYGEWATKKIRSRAGAQLASLLLGIIIFIDDYFNCLTVGTVMTPVTDRYRVSRAKLAYIIDSTAAPICVLAPVSSWVVTIMSTMGDKFRDVGINLEPFTAFMQTVPMNLYAWGTLVMVAFVALTELDFGPMGRFEREAKATGNVYGPGASDEKALLPKVSRKGTVLDLVVPVVGLIAFAIIMMAYTGGYFVDDIGFLDAIKNTDAASALMYAGFLSLALALVMFIGRGVVPVTRLPEAAWRGFLSMVPAILILCFAWTIGGVISQLGTGLFLATRVGQALNPALYPVIMFILACIIAFSTGTSWGTFAIMIPIAVDFSVLLAPNLLLGMIAAVLAGAVYGDHCSPISDTTILSSTGAGCRHIDHVSTQLPYATLSAVMCGIGYIVYGFMAQAGASQALVTIVTLVVTLGLLMLALKALNALTRGAELKARPGRRVA